MPFTSKAQWKAGFSGHLGPEMQSKAHEWAHEAPNLKSLPQHVKHGVNRRAMEQAWSKPHARK